MKNNMNIKIVLLRSGVFCLSLCARFVVVTAFCALSVWAGLSGFRLLCDAVGSPVIPDYIPWAQVYDVLSPLLTEMVKLALPVLPVVWLAGAAVCVWREKSNQSEQAAEK